MKKAIVSALFALVFIAAMSSFAASVKGPQEFTDKVYIRDGSLYLENTAVSATAAELNILDGVTASAAELNRLDGGMPASNITAGTIPASAGAIGLGTNVSLRGVLVPVSGGPMTLGTNVSIASAASLSEDAGAIALGTNVALTGSQLNAVSFPVAGGVTALGTNVTLGGASLRAGTIPESGGAIAGGTNITLTGANLSAPVFSASGGAIALKTNMNYAATIGPVVLPTNVVPSGGVSGTIDATTVVSVVNGVITGLGL